MSHFDWEGFLRKWSKEIVAFDNHSEFPYFCIGFSPEQIESSWVGYNGATDLEIEQLESRIGLSLPTSYKEFLKVSNGWLWTTPGILKLYSTEEVTWFKEKNQELIDDWCEEQNTYGDVPDEEYFLYGDERILYSDERFLGFRVDYLRTSLEIAYGNDSEFYLLNPQIIFPNKEWEAWCWSNNGPRRYRSFEELMQSEYKMFLDFKERS